MDQKLITAIIRFLRKYPEYTINNCVATQIGMSFFQKIFEGDDTKIILKEAKHCPLVNSFSDILSDYPFTVPDYSKITEKYTITIIYKDTIVYQDAISELEYIAFCNFGKVSNNSINSIRTPTLTEFINKYYG